MDDLPDLTKTSLPELMQDLQEVEVAQVDLYPWFSPPFHYIPMPLNADGDGPEMDAGKVTRTEHQVWNGAFLPVATCPSEAAARYIANLLNRLRPPSDYEHHELEAANGVTAIADLLRRWQTEQSEWFTNPTLEIVAEYAAWREKQET